MNFVDLIILIIILLAWFIGYRKGFFQKLYNLLIVIFSILFSFLLKNIIGLFIINIINLGELEHNQIYELLKSRAISFLGFLIVYPLIYILLKILVRILMKKKIIPSNRDYLKYGGAIINVLETLFVLSIVGCTLSFGSYISIDYYDNSLLLKPIYRLNFPLYAFGNKLHTIVDNGIKLSKKMEIYKNDPSKIISDPEGIETIKLLFETGILDEDLIVDSSKKILENVNREEINFEKIRNENIFEILKELYNENILTKRLIHRIVNENNLTGFDVETLVEAFGE